MIGKKLRQTGKLVYKGISLLTYGRHWWQKYCKKKDLTFLLKFSRY